MKKIRIISIVYLFVLLVLPKDIYAEYYKYTIADLGGIGINGSGWSKAYGIKKTTELKDSAIKNYTNVGAEDERWVLYGELSDMKYYFYPKSLTLFPNNVVRVHTRAVNVKRGIIQTSLTEYDCFERKWRNLEIRNDKNPSPDVPFLLTCDLDSGYYVDEFGNSRHKCGNWRYVQHEGLDRALYEKICSKKTKDTVVR